MHRHPRLSLKLRLFVLVTALMASLCVVAGVYIVIRAQKDIRGEVRSATDLIQHFLRAQLAAAEGRSNDDWRMVPSLDLAELHDVRHAQISFYAPDGTLIESSVDAGERKHHAPGWFSWLVERTFRPIPDISQPVVFRGSTVGSVVIHPDPTFEIEEIWNVTRGLLGLMLVFFVLVNALIWWAVASSMRPVIRIGEALAALGAGRLEIGRAHV